MSQAAREGGWRSTDDDPPDWKDGPGYVEMKDETGAVSVGFLDFDEGGGDGPEITLTIEGEWRSFYDFVEWRVR